MTNHKLSVHICVFAVSIAMLMLQVSFTRILSVAQWYHFAFLVISIALFGIGAAGTFLSVFPSLLERELIRMLPVLTFLFSLSIILSFLLTNTIPFDPFRITWDTMQLVYIMVFYLLLSIPFFFGGMIITLALTQMEDVGRIYFSSLIGSALGSVLVIPLSALGATTIGLSAIIAALSLTGFTERRRLSMIWLALLLIVTLSFPQIHISPYKTLNIALSYPDSQIITTQWNAHSRVDVIESPLVRYAPGLSILYRGEIPDQLGITVDADQLTAVTRWNGHYSSIDFVEYLPTSLPFHLNQGSTLILGAGGGMDVLTALYFNATPVTAVESNQLVADVMRNKYGDFSGGWYDQANVEISDSRSFVKRSRDKYDTILLTLTDSTPASTGIYALTENYVYTVEAFQDYYDHLSENGTLSITRYVLPPPRESLRIVSLAVAAMEKKGIEHPENQIAVIRSWGTITILIKKSEFTHDDITTIRAFVQERNFDLVYVPGIAPHEANVYNKFPEPYYYQNINLLFSDRDRFYENYLFEVSPVTDERPFFFQFFKFEKLEPTYKSMGKKWQPFVEGGYMIPIIFFQALVLSLIFILLPLRRIGKYPQKKGILVYFLCLGIGFMFIEITLIQKFILFLGHPVYAVSAVLFSLLLFAGLGSFSSERLKSPIKVIPALSLLILLYLLILPQIFYVFLGHEIIIRYLISLITIAPLGFLMGMPFPLGVRITKMINPELIPWAWAVNGCASVLGSILVIMIALSWGFSSVLVLASAVYLMGLVFMYSSSRLLL